MSDPWTGPEGTVAARARSFGAQAEAYERTRPPYPDVAAAWLAPGSPRLVVELGAGTGKLTRALAARDLTVLAVEPDPRMRAVLERLALPGVRVVDGTAEAIPADAGAADVVVSGSAFHWFDLDGMLVENARVLGKGGTLSFAWNTRDGSDPTTAALSALISGTSPEPWIGDRPWEDLVPESGIFGAVERAEFEHQVVLPRERIGDFLRSYSRVSARPADEQRELERRALAALDGPDVRLRFVVRAYRTKRT